MIFISHSSENYDSHVAPLCEKLDKLGYSYWLSTKHLLPGENYMSKELTQAIVDCSVFLVVVSKESQETSVWVRKELECALQERKLIIGYKIDDYPNTTFRLAMMDEHMAVHSKDGFSKVLQTLEKKGEPHSLYLDGKEIVLGKQVPYNDGWAYEIDGGVCYIPAEPQLEILQRECVYTKEQILAGWIQREAKPELKPKQKRTPKPKAEPVQEAQSELTQEAESTPEPKPKRKRTPKPKAEPVQEAKLPAEPASEAKVETIADTNAGPEHASSMGVYTESGRWIVPGRVLYESEETIAYAVDGDPTLVFIKYGQPKPKDKSMGSNDVDLVIVHGKVVGRIAPRSWIRRRQGDELFFEDGRAIVLGKEKRLNLNEKKESFAVEGNDSDEVECYYRRDEEFWKEMEEIFREDEADQAKMYIVYDSDRNPVGVYCGEAVYYHRMQKRKKRIKVVAVFTDLLSVTCAIFLVLYWTDRISFSKSMFNCLTGYMILHYESYILGVMKTAVKRKWSKSTRILFFCIGPVGNMLLKYPFAWWKI